MICTRLYITSKNVIISIAVSVGLIWPRAVSHDVTFSYSQNTKPVFTMSQIRSKSSNLTSHGGDRHFAKVKFSYFVHVA